MPVYIIKYTNSTKASIFINPGSLNVTTLDVTLIGFDVAEYGSSFDENTLHLLENFAALESTQKPGNPDLTQVINPLLRQPTEGEFWFNKTQQRMFVYTSSGWKQLSAHDDVSGNSGIIAHGQQIPLPAAITEYSQCSWFVSPQYIDRDSNYIECYTDSNAIVYSRYRPSGTNILVDGLANYIIIGEKTNTNIHPVFPLPSVPLPQSSTPTPTPTQSITPTSTPAIGASPTQTVTPTLTPTITVTPSVSLSLTPTPTVTPTHTPTVTPSNFIFPFTMTAQIDIISPQFFTIGYNNPQMGVPLNGSLNPTGFFGYYVSAVQRINSFFNITMTTIGGGAAPPINTFSSVSFIDITGKLRVFALSGSTFEVDGQPVTGGSGYSTNVDPSGNNLASWNWQLNNNDLLFNNGATYTILIQR